MLVSRRTRRTQAWIVCLVVAAGPAVHAAAYNESASGDLSGTPATPTAWTLDTGANQLVGSAGTSADYDLISLTIPAGHQLDSLVLDAYVLDFTNSSFVGLASGGVWPTGLGSSVSGSALLGWELFSDANIGADLLPNMGANTGLFTPPLSAGVYTMLLQDTASPFTYGFTLNVSAVPEPAALALAGAGCVAALVIRRKSAASRTVGRV